MCCKPITTFSYVVLTVVAIKLKNINVVLWCVLMTSLIIYCLSATSEILMLHVLTKYFQWPLHFQYIFLKK